MIVTLYATAPYASDETPATEGEALILGLRTVVYPVTDLEQAKQWYTRVLGHGPCFDEPFIIENPQFKLEDVQ